MCAENALCHAAGLKQGKAQQDRIAHAAPDSAGNIVGCSDGLYQHRINADAHHNEKGLKA